MAQANKKKKPTSAKQWKKAAGNTPVELELPSGNVCLARAPGMQAFVEAGLFPNSLLQVVTKALESGETELDPEAMMKSIVGDGSDASAMVKNITQLADKVVLHCVVEPKVLPATVPDPREPGGLRVLSEAERDPEELYVDEVDFDDKLFIFNWAVGGTARLENFREGPQAGVDAVQPRQEVVDTTE